MSADPISRIQAAFGDVLVRRRRERQWTAGALATASGLPEGLITGFERGDYGPNLNDFFRIARALGHEPAILLVDVIAEWRAGPFDTRYTSRASDFARLFRLGYDHKPGDFRELSTAYYSVAEAMHAAAHLNAKRHTRGVALLDTVCIYVRLDYVSFRSDDGQREGEQP
jgi:transcriptional regulator with XRE-family HTH domain